MEVVIDSVSLNHLYRTDRQTKKRRKSKNSMAPNHDLNSSIDEYLSSSILVICVDPDLGLISEWKDTVGEELIQNLVVRWTDENMIRIVDVLGKISRQAGPKLRKLGFTDTIDKLIIRIALATQDKIIISTDSDFWDPKTPGLKCPIGDASAPVPKICKQYLDITILSLTQLFEELKKAA